MEGIDNSIIDFCKQLEIYIQSDYYKSQIAIGAFSTRFNKFLSDNKIENYRLQRNLLNEKISNLLIAIEKGYVTVFPESDLTPDYIQDLEDAQQQIIKESVFNRA